MTNNKQQTAVDSIIEFCQKQMDNDSSIHKGVYLSIIEFCKEQITEESEIHWKTTLLMMTSTDTANVDLNKPLKEYEIIIPQEEPKQETLEEAAAKEFPLLDTKSCRTGAAEEENFQLHGYRRSFIKGAKWQAGRMYSEAEVQLILSKLLTDIKNGNAGNSVEWFEQFKKK